MDNTTYTDEKREPNRESGSPQGNTTRIILIILALLIAGALVWMIYGNNVGTNQAAVAEVNGEEISRSEYDRAIESVRQSYEQSGAEVNVEDAQIRQQALESLINQRLGLSAATEAGITVSDEEIDSQLEEIRSQMPSEEAFQQQLSAVGLTEAELREELRRQIRLQKFFDSRIADETMTVTDEEIQEIYDSQVATGEDASAAPALTDDVEDRVRSQLENQKRNQEIQNIFAELRADADIEIFIDQPGAGAGANAAEPEGPEPTESQNIEAQGEGQTQTGSSDTEESATENNPGVE